MTDEEGVEERYQLTEANLVRPLPHPHPRSTYANNTLHQKREIRDLARGVKPGDRRLFYCMNIASRRFLSPTLMLPQRLVAGHSSQLSYTAGSEEEGMDEGECPQLSRLFTYTERSIMLVFVAADGRRIGDNVRRSCPSTYCGMEILTFPSRRFAIGC